MKDKVLKVLIVVGLALPLCYCIAWFHMNYRCVPVLGWSGNAVCDWEAK